MRNRRGRRGGLAGLWTALELARRGRDVVVVEAGRIGEGACGRNAGFVSPGYAEDPAKIVARVGERHARALWRLSVEGVEAVRTAAADMPGVDPVAGRLIAFRTAGEDAAARLAERVARWGSLAELWRGPEVREVLATARYRAALALPEGFHLHPLNFVIGLAAAVEAAGGRIFEQSPVVHADLDGVRKRIETPQGRLRAHEVVVCGSAGVGRAFPVLAQSIVPVATHIGVTAPLGDRLAAAIRYSGAVSDNRPGGDNFRVVGERLLWGGRITTRTRPPAQLHRLIASDIAAVFPQLAGIEVAHAWSGVMGVAAHKMPQVGRLGPGLWLASAFGDHGLAATASTGWLIASAILDGDDRWRLFIPFGLVPAGVLGRITVQLGYWSMQLRDRRDEMLLRRAEQREKAEAPPAILPPASASDLVAPPPMA